MEMKAVLQIAWREGKRKKISPEAEESGREGYGSWCVASSGLRLRATLCCDLLNFLLKT